jgi:diketogulonate reductase-like aldo/keto reductase
MEELVAEGFVRNIGVSNFGIGLLRDLLSYAKVKPSVLQIELHPYNAQNILLKFCKENGVVVTAYSPLGGSSYLELGMSKTEELILERAEVKKIAQCHGVNPAQVVLRWALQRGTSVVVKSNKSERMKENLDLFGFELSKEEMEKIEGININKRFNDPAVFCKAAFGAFFPIFEE